MFGGSSHIHIVEADRIVAVSGASGLFQRRKQFVSPGLGYLADGRVATIPEGCFDLLAAEHFGGRADFDSAIGFGQKFKPAIAGQLFGNDDTLASLIVMNTPFSGIHYQHLH